MAPMLVRRLLLVLLVLLSRAESGRPPTPAPPLVRPCSVPGLPFCNGSLSITARAADLVARLCPDCRRVALDPLGRDVPARGQGDDYSHWLSERVAATFATCLAR